jgi:hypothetical protein
MMLKAILDNFWYKEKVRLWVRTLLNLEPNPPEPEPAVQFQVQPIASTEPQVRF